MKKIQEYLNYLFSVKMIGFQDLLVISHHHFFSLHLKVCLLYLKY